MPHLHVGKQDWGSKARPRRAIVLLLIACTGPLGCQSLALLPEQEATTAPSAPPKVVGAPGPGTGQTPETKGKDEVGAVRQVAFSSDQKSGANDKNTSVPLPVVPSACAEFAIDLETALGLAGAENPTIALAQEAVRESLAEQLQARALLLPTLDAGGNFNLHRGNLLAARGIVRDVDRQALYVGAGAAAIGAGAVGFPGVRVTAHLADAIFDPLAAVQRVTSREYGALATRNAVLLEVVTRYLDLAGAEAGLLAFRQSESELAEVAKLTADFARTGQGRQADADRARTNALLLHSQTQQAEESVYVVGADLARLLHMDAAIRLRTPGGPLPLVPLVDPKEPLDQLVPVAMSNRPEVAAWAATIGEYAIRLRQERVRPFVPMLSAGFSAGGFGGGSDLADTRFGHFNGRTDVEVMAVWSLENLGLGNFARQRRRRAEVNEANEEQAIVVDRVRREVAEAHALSAARRREVDVARLRVETAGRAFQADLKRAKNLEGRPIEILNSANLLAAARQDLIRALVGYNQAQFQLFVALGQPPTMATPGGKCF